MTQRSFLCRCEDVTLEEIDHAISLGLSEIEELKRYTGLGTGPCQGRECLAPLARQIAARRAELEAKGEDAELFAPLVRLQPFTPRPPLEPVSFGALASLRYGDAADAQRAVTLGSDHPETVDEDPALVEGIDVDADANPEEGSPS